MASLIVISMLPQFSTRTKSTALLFFLAALSLIILKGISYNNLIEKRKFENSIKLYDDNKNLILSGPYKDTKFSRDNFWGIGDLGAKTVSYTHLTLPTKA